MKTYRVGLIGFGFIGKVHAYGHINLPLFFDQQQFRTKITHVCTSRPDSAQKGTEQVGAEYAVTDFREITENPDIDIVHICTPNNLHKAALLSAIAHNKHIYCDKPLVVVGGGDSAMEEATFLTKYGSTVYIVHRRDEFRASKIMAERALANEKIVVKWNSVIDEVLGDDEKGVTGVRIRSSLDDSQTEDLEAAGYFAAIGHTPNTDFLKGQLETNDKGYLIWPVSHRTNTSVEGVFAAGDVADDHYKQAVTAAGTGCAAALDAERWLAAQGLE